MKDAPQIANNDALEALTKQMEQLSLNYANIVNVLAAQAENSKPKNNPPRTSNVNNNNNNRRPFDISQVVCFRCNEKGHYAKNCMSKE